ncbi:MAG: hypothetical protein V4760_19315 [Bdellovibrionota bacterium]
MKNAVVFAGRNGLDFIELRAGVLRIPEVTLRIREAQRILDTTDLPKIDLFNVVSSEDDHFFRNIKLKSLLAAIVQVGLFDRYVKNQRRPDFMVGNSNGDAAMMVAAGLMTFEQMVRQSQALDTMKPSERVVSLAVEPAPLLAGLSLTEFRALQAVQTDTGLTYQVVNESAMELKKSVGPLHADQAVGRFINLGPAAALRRSEYETISADDIESIDSIELDPMLGWFWSSIRSQSIAIAQ